jgi:Tol biopolymer transport system component/DNA-binding winged helix-turn-helix (wHTH) protein
MLSMAPPGGSHFRFGMFEADPASGEFWKNGRRIRLQEQPFRLLVLLVAHAGAVVTREELQKSLWPADTFVEFDYGLNTAIKKLRQALGDSDNPRFIETLPRKGYRFIAPVSGGEAQAPVSQRVMWKGRWTLAVLGATVAVAMVVWLIRSRAAPQLSPVPLTTYRGVETQPSFSPDGRYVAFAWNGEREDNFDIYVKQIGTDQPVRLTTDPAPDLSPAWSPDGRLIAFGRTLKARRTSILLVPAAGGPEVKVTEVATRYNTQPEPLLAWSPDGKWLAVTDRDDTRAGQSLEDAQLFPGFWPRSLFLVSIETGARRPLTSPSGDPVVDAGPAFSPEGRRMAFVRTVGIDVSDLYVLPLSPGWAPTGAPRRLTWGNQVSTSPAWTKDGDSIVFVAGPEHDLRLFRIPASGKGVVRPLQLVAGRTSSVSISRQGKLAYSQISANSHIWRVTLSGPGVVADAAKQFAASTRLECNPQFSADGKRLVFVSSRGGSIEIWISNTDGTNPVPLTSMNAAITGGPNWSPDGSHIVFDSNKGGQWEVYAIGAAGGTPQRLTENPATDGVPSWSQDGAWIYFMSSRSGQAQVWKMPAGGGQPVQVTKQGGYVAVESPDGRFVYYSKSSTAAAGLWRVPVRGGEETEVLPSVTLLNFAVTNDGIYYIPSANAQGQYSIHYFSFATGKSVSILGLSYAPGPGIAVSPDGKTLLYTLRDDRSSDLMLVEDFR